VTAFVAFGFICAALTSRWVVIGLIYGAIIEGGLGNAPLAINRLAMTHQTRVMVHSLVGRHWTGSDLASLAHNAHPWAAAGILALIAIAWVSAAAAIFSRQELVGDGGNE